MNKTDTAELVIKVCPSLPKQAQEVLAKFLAERAGTLGIQTVERLLSLEAQELSNRVARKQWEAQ